MPAKPTCEELEQKLTVLDKLIAESRVQKGSLQSEKQFRCVYEESPIGIELYDPYGKLLDVNKACLDIFGVSDVREVQGFGLFEDPNVTDELKARLRNGETVRYEVAFDFGKVKELKLYETTKSGTIYLDVMIAPQTVRPDDSVKGYLVLVQDQTERKKAEEALEKAHAELEQKVEERTAELVITNEQLKAENKERQRVVKALRESEERYRALFEQAADSIVLIDSETGALVEFNERTHRSLGYSRKEFEKLKIPDFEVIESAEEVAVHIKNVIEEGSDIFETKHLTKSGEIRDIWVSSRAITIGEKNFIQSIWRDIGDLKRAKEELRKSETRYSLATIAGQVGVWDWNIETNEIYIDPNLKMMLGYEDHEIKNHMDNWAKFVHPDDMEQVMAEAQSHLDGLTPHYEIAHRMLHKNGGFRWFLARGNAIRDANGKPYRMIGTDVDITLQKQVGEQLWESEERYRTLIAKMINGFALHEILCDPAGKPCDYRFLEINSAFEEMTGLKTEEIVGKTVLEVLPQTESYWIDTYGKVALTGESIRFANYSQELSKYFEVLAYRPKKGQFATVFTDITERKQEEEEREKLKAQLLQAQKMEAIATLAGGIAHQFNLRYLR